MADRLAVGVASGCTAPLKLELTSMRLLTLTGIDSITLPDHYCGFVPRSVWGPQFTPAAKVVPSPDAFFDPFVMLGAMATRYRRVRIGTGVTEPIRRHPVTLAQAFVTVDHLTRGRAILGIGNGERENTVPYGLPFDRRVARLEEALEIIRRCFASGGEPIDFDGRFWRLRRALFATPLYGGRAPTIWMAAHAPRMLGLTGRYADGWFPTQKMAPAEYRERLDRVHAAAAASGRSTATFEPALQIQLVIGRDRRSALGQMVRLRPAAAMSMLLPGTVWARHGLAHPLGNDFEGFADIEPEALTPAQIDAAARQVTPELLGDGVVAGSIDEIVAEMRALVDAGLRHVVTWNLGPLANGASAADLVRFLVLLRRLRKLPLPPRRTVSAPQPAAWSPSSTAAPSHTAAGTP